MNQQQTFFNHFAPVALAICAMIDAEKGTMFPETLMVQAADETGFHTQGCSQGQEGWKGKNNFSGISPTVDGTPELADYATTDDYVKAYVQVIEQNAFGYPLVLQSTNPELQMVRLGRSSWAGSHYDAAKTGRPGHDLVSIYHAYQTEIESALNDARAAEHSDPTPSEPAQSDPAPQQPESVHDATEHYTLGLFKTTPDGSVHIQLKLK